MRRKIEVRKRGTSDPWATASLGPEYVGPSFEWRYVGGVLECRDADGGGEWRPLGAHLQHYTPDAMLDADEEARRTTPFARKLEYRLRPYDDAGAAPLTAKWQGQCIQCGSPFSLTVPTGCDAYYGCPCGLTTVRDGDRIDRRPSTAVASGGQGGGASTDQRTKEKRAAIDAQAMAIGDSAWSAYAQRATRRRTAEELESEVTRQAAKLVEQRETIRSLTDSRDAIRRERDTARTASTQRGDELGEAKARITELEAECFRWRRRAEDAERKAKVRR